MTSVYLLLIFLTFAPTSYCKKPRFHPILSEGSKNNPGLKMRLQEKGVNELNRVAIKIIKEEISNAKIPDTDQKLPKDRGTIKLRNTKLSIPDAGESKINFESPNKVSWAIRHLKMIIETDLGGKINIVMPITLEGHLKASASDVNFEIETVLGEKYGKPTIRATRCQTSINEIKATLTRGGGFQMLFDMFKKQGIDQVAPQMEKMLCQMAKKMIDKQANEFLNEVPLKAPITEVGNAEYMEKVFENTKLGKEIKKVTGLRKPRKIEKNRKKREIENQSLDLEKMYIDYSLLKDQRVTSDFVESFHKGEVSYEGKGNTPFYPSPITEPQPMETDRMFYFFLSDYAINSLFFHVQKTGQFNFELSPENLSEICEMEKSLCNLGKDSELSIKHKRAPAAIFGKKKNTVDTLSNLKLSAGKKLLAQVDSKLNGTVNLWINGSSIVGHLKYRNFENSLTKSAKDFDKKKSKKIQKLAAYVLEKWTNDFLMKGLPLPNNQYIKLVRPYLSMEKRTLIVESDFELDEERIRKAIRDAVKNVDFKMQINTP